MPLISGLKAVVANFGPRWFSAILDEAETSPATIAGLFFVWLTIVALAIFSWLTFTDHANAAEQTMTQIQQTLAANTKALNCNRQDRVITAKVREMTVVSRLLDHAEDNAERRDLREQIQRLERELDSLESKYKNECL